MEKFDALREDFDQLKKNEIERKDASHWIRSRDSNSSCGLGVGQHDELRKTDPVLGMKSTLPGLRAG